MLRGINRCLRDRIAAADQKVLVIQSGLRKVFSSATPFPDPDSGALESFLVEFHETLRLLRSIDQPTIALVQDGCFGSGWELVLACDLVVASDRASFSFPEISRGLFPPAGTVLLPTRCGPQVALDLILTGRTIQAKQALQAGLVARVLSYSKFGQQSKSLLKEFSRNSMSSMRFAKRSLREGLEQTDEDGLHNAESIYLESLLKTPDATEGIQAWLEKRPPKWDY
jgi:enoyl-CoA hydratase/carnithine racemase